MDALILI